MSPPLANWKWDPQAGPKSVPQYRTCLAAHLVLSLLPILFLHHPPFFVQSTIFNPYISLPRLLQTLSVYALCLSSLEVYFLELSLNRLASLTPGHQLLDARHLDLLRPNPAVTDHNEFCENKNRPSVSPTSSRLTSTPHISSLVVNLINLLDLVYLVVAPLTSHPTVDASASRVPGSSTPAIPDYQNTDASFALLHGNTIRHSSSRLPFTVIPTRPLNGVVMPQRPRF